MLTIAKGKFSGKGFKDRRGGKRANRDQECKEKEVMEFIKQLRVSESHYSRAKTKRLYLSSELSVSELHRTYNKKVPTELKVNAAYSGFK